MKKFRRAALILAAAMALSVFTSCSEAGGASQEEKTSGNTSSVKTAVSVKVQSGTENVAETSGESSVILKNDAKLTASSQIIFEVTGSKYLLVRLSSLYEKDALLYLPDGKFIYTVPADTDVYPAGAWRGAIDISAHIPSAEELGAEKNLAYSPYDLQKQTAYFPHASSNSECRNDNDFMARNAVDGFTKNTGHGGYPYQSWGPEQIAAPEITVDLGRKCKVTSVTLYIRADFPHDTAWQTGDIFFSDGGSTHITIEKTSNAQTFTFDARETTSITLKNLTAASMGWAGITEIEVNGCDIL